MGYKDEADGTRKVENFPSQDYVPVVGIFLTRDGVIGAVLVKCSLYVVEMDCNFWCKKLV